MLLMIFDVQYVADVAEFRFVALLVVLLWQHE